MLQYSPHQRAAQERVLKRLRDGARLVLVRDFAESSVYRLLGKASAEGVSEEVVTAISGLIKKVALGKPHGTYSILAEWKLK